MGMQTGNSGGGSKSEINVTPLVDVCLVLLIIFMVMVPKTVPEISVRVPRDAEPEVRRKHDDALVMHVDATGAIHLDQEFLTHAQLSERLTAALSNRERRVVFLDCDPDAQFGRAMAALDVAKRAGADVLGVVARRNEPIPDRLEPR